MFDDPQISVEPASPSALPPRGGAAAFPRASRSPAARPIGVDASLGCYCMYIVSIV